MRERAGDSVFLNVPFDAQYEPLFVTLVGTLVFLRFKARCVLEVREAGQGRLARIFDLIRSCPMSFHDVSRVGRPARFNMPFELGLACAVSLTTGEHEVFVMDSEPYRMDRTLSDYKGRDPLIHHGRCDDVVAAVLDVVGDDSSPSVGDLRLANRRLRTSARELKREYDAPTVFRPSIFRTLVAAAVEVARDEGFVAP